MKKICLILLLFFLISCNKKEELALLYNTNWNMSYEEMIKEHGDEFERIVLNDIISYSYDKFWSILSFHYKNGKLFRIASVSSYSNYMKGLEACTVPDLDNKDFYKKFSEFFYAYFYKKIGEDLSLFGEICNLESIIIDKLRVERLYTYNDMKIRHEITLIPSAEMYRVIFEK